MFDAVWNFWGIYKFHVSENNTKLKKNNTNLPWKKEHTSNEWINECAECKRTNRTYTYGRKNTAFIYLFGSIAIFGAPEKKCLRSILIRESNLSQFFDDTVYDWIECSRGYWIQTHRHTHVNSDKDSLRNDFQNIYRNRLLIMNKLDGTTTNSKLFSA